MAFSTDEALDEIFAALAAAKKGDWSNPHPMGTTDYRWYEEGLARALREQEERRQKLPDPGETRG